MLGYDPYGPQRSMQQFGQNLRGLGSDIMAARQRRQQMEFQNRVRQIMGQNTQRVPQFDPKTRAPLMDPTTGKQKEEIKQNRPAILAGLQQLGPQGMAIANQQQQMWMAEDAAKNRQKKQNFAPKKYQKFVDEDGMMRIFDPEKGTVDYAYDPEGKKVPAQDYYRYYESDEGPVPLSTKRPPRKAPAPVQGLTPAGQRKRKLEEQKAKIQIGKLEHDIEKTKYLDKLGGQFKATQYQTALYGKRMSQASEVIDQLANEGFDRTKWTMDLLDKIPNQLKKSQLQRQSQAERNFVNATLRRESGAAIAPSEFESAEKQYFPRAGDGPKVLEQKRQNRNTAIAAMKAEAGGAWSELEAQLKTPGSLKAPTGPKRRKATLEDF